MTDIEELNLRMKTSTTELVDQRNQGFNLLFNQIAELKSEIAVLNEKLKELTPSVNSTDTPELSNN